MHQRARQESAPALSAVVVDTEISARLRGGAEWDVADAVAVAVLARPVDLDSRHADLAWLAAGLAGADALSEVTGDHFVCHWPDEVRTAAARPAPRAGAVPARAGEPAPAAGPGTTGTAAEEGSADGGRVRAGAGLKVAATAATRLGPGRVDYAVLVVRVAPAGADGAAAPTGEAEAVTAPGELVAGGTRTELVDALVRHGRRCARLLDEPAELLRRYCAGCATLGQRVVVRLAPTGETRGVVTGIANDGALVVRSATGLAQNVAVGSFRSLTLLPPPDA